MPTHEDENVHEEPGVPDSSAPPERGNISKANMPISDFFLRIYDQALKFDGKLDHDILQQECNFGREDAYSTKITHGGTPIETSALPSYSYHEDDDSIRRHRANTEKQHKLFYKKLLEQENLLKMQEERKAQAQEEIIKKELTTQKKENKAERLLREALIVQKETLQTKETVEVFKQYKDYVEKSVPLWGEEAKSVDGVCGRFRDLLTLRFQLMSQVDEAFSELQIMRKKHQQLIQNERVAEGRALLQVYRYRTSLWNSVRELETSERQLRSLRNLSAEIATNLTRVRLALANMYSVARRFQGALPPLQPDTQPTLILHRLHNFILDATQVVFVAQQEEDPDSVKPEKGSA